MDFDLSALLKRHFAENEVSVRAVARRMGMDHAYLVRVINGSLALPRKHCDGLADALALQGNERASFMRAAALSRCPDEIRALVAQLDAEVTKLREELRK